MLKVKDLRVGNYICSSLTKSVVEVSTKLLRLMESEIRVKGETTYKGIPITEEILLLKCGFEKRGNDYVKGSFFFFAQSTEDDGTFINTECGRYRSGIRSIISFTVESLHDLQNVYYYCHSKKELEVEIELRG